MSGNRLEHPRMNPRFPLDIGSVGALDHRFGWLVQNRAPSCGWSKWQPQSKTAWRLGINESDESLRLDRHLRHQKEEPLPQPPPLNRCRVKTRTEPRWRCVPASLPGATLCRLGALGRWDVRPHGEVEDFPPTWGRLRGCE